MEVPERKIPLLYAVGAILIVLGCLLTAVIGLLVTARSHSVSTVPTTVQEAAIPSTFTPVPTRISTETPQATFTAQPTLTPLPSYTPLPTHTPYPTSGAQQPNVLPSLTPMPQFVGSEAEFRAYIRQRYSSIAGRPLEIENVRVSDTSLSIQLSENSASVFADQTRAAATEYGENLLRDTASYFGRRDSSIRVFELFYTFYLSDAYFDDEWYFIGTYDLDDGWPVYKDYIWGFYYSDGRESLRVWNYQ